jgi:hypothetical protein
MTSRDGSRRRLQDQLDVEIRWVLRAGVADARPPARVWGRIVERLEQEAGVRESRPWRGFCLACQSLALRLLGSAEDLPAEFAYCHSPRLCDVRDMGYLRLLVYQCDFPALLGKAI